LPLTTCEEGDTELEVKEHVDPLQVIVPNPGEN